MRHINFDESSVLTEFAKIAHEQGFIKEAQEPEVSMQPRGEQGPEAGVGKSRTIEPIDTSSGATPPSSAKILLNKLFKQYPNISALYSGQIPSEPQKVQQSIEPFFTGLRNGLMNKSGIVSSEYSKIADELVTKLQKYFETVVSGRKKLVGHVKKVLNPSLERFRSSNFVGPARQVQSADDNAADSSAADAVIKQLSSVTGPTMTVAKQLAKEIEMYKGDPNAGATLSRRWKQQPWLGYVNQAFPQAQSAQQQSPADTVIKQLSAITGPTMPVAQQLAKEISMYKGDPNAAGTLRRRWKDEPWSKYVNQAFPQKSASVEEPMSKSAKEEGKKYDVTGEEGKDLVDKAHPGGGTKTELTHSKTDENLVETIVEQQEKDIDVAKSVPKGTYAALVDLAGRLDKLGLYAEADEIDDILRDIKKKADNYSVNVTKSELLDTVKRLSRGNPEGDAAVRFIQNIPSNNFSADDLRQLMGYAQSNLAGTKLDFVMNGIREVMQNAGISSNRQPTGGKPETGGVAGDVKTELTDIQKRRRYWKRLYNNAIKNINEDIRKKYKITPLPVNVKKTTEFMEALRKVKKTKADTLKEFVDIMNSKSKPAPAQQLPPMPGSIDVPPPQGGLVEPELTGIKNRITPRYEDVFAQLEDKYYNRFNSPEFELGKNPLIFNHLNDYARKIVKWYAKNSKLTPQDLNNIMNRIIQNLISAEDIRAIRNK